MDFPASDEEEARLAALAACSILDTPREPSFDHIVFTAAQLFRVPIALLNLVDSDRAWAKAAVGPLAQTLRREDTFCRVVVETGQVLVVEDAVADARFAALPCVIAEPRVRFCASAPLFGPGRHVVGALCVLDRHPRAVPDRQRQQLQQLAHEAGELLRLRVPGLDVSRS